MIDVENTCLLFAERFKSDHYLFPYQLCYIENQRVSEYPNVSLVVD